MKFMLWRTIIFLCGMLDFSFAGYCQTITTFAGNGTPGYTGDGGAANSCELTHPYGIAIDGSGNVYIADRGNNCIRKITAGGTITSIVGNGINAYSGDNGPATAAELAGPAGVAVDVSGNVYIGDAGNNRVRKVDNSGIITTIAGNGTGGYNGDNIPATDAELSGPRGIALDGNGDIYVADPGNNRVRKITLSSGIITTAAGKGTGAYSGDGGPATAAELKPPYAITFDKYDHLYICDVDNERIRKVSAGIIMTIAGNGTAGYTGDNVIAIASELNEPTGMAADASGNLYIADGWNGRIRQINNAGIITTVAGKGTLGYSGDGGPAALAELNDPYGIATDTGGNMYIADYANNRIRYVTHTTGVQVIPGAIISTEIYPNPGAGTFTVCVMGVKNEPVQITVKNITGAQVMSFLAIAGKPIEVKSGLPAGMYFLTAKTTRGTSVSKLVVSP
jgi:trimeric autotransporter adhesin